jgi:outer membrane protein assembly factor BamB
MESELVLKEPSVGVSPLPGAPRFSLWKSLTVSVLLCLPFAAAMQADDAQFNEKGHIVIADQYNNRVIEIDPATHKIVWQFGDGSSVPGPHSIVGTNDAERFGTLTLISGTGIPPLAAFTTPPTQSAIPVPLPGCPVAAQQNGAGCPDNRVILVNQDGEIVWQYGQDGGVAGSGPDQLNTPVAATVLPNGNFLITDQANERIIEVTLNKTIVWQYGMTGVSGIGADQLNNPNSAELLANGNVLIADENNNRAIEVTHDLAHPNNLSIVATFTAGGTASGVAFASRLPSGNTLLTDSNNSRVVEVDKNDGIVRQFVTNDPTAHPGTVASPFLPLPTRAIQLSNGNVLISDQYNDQVIEVTPSGSIGGTIVFAQGQVGFPGDLFNHLNGPYDAKVIGDFTGLTPPPHFAVGQ